MALIECPECGGKLSDTIKQCIHCGYVLVNTKCNIKGTVYDFSNELTTALSEKPQCLFAIGDIRRKTGLTLSDGDDLLTQMRKLKEVPQVFTPKYPFETKKQQPKCPTCQSTNIEKISLTKKAVGGALFGLFSSNVRKTMHCKNCGYKW